MLVRWWPGLLLVSAACEDDVNITEIVDLGTPDAAMMAEALPLQEGMFFDYSAFLRFDESSSVSFEGRYDIRVTITEVDDTMGNGSSRVSFTVEDLSPADMNPDWRAPQDFDSWVSRLGPSVDTDVVGPDAVVRMVGEIPQMPPAPTGGKVLPQPGSFFIDVRELTQIGSDWTDAEATRDPSVNLPASADTSLVLSSRGADANVQFHTGKERSVSLEYNQLGVLDLFREDLGIAGSEQSENRLELISMGGP